MHRRQISTAAVATALTALIVGASAAQAQTIDDYLLFGIDRDNGALVRHSFLDNATSTVGTIEIKSSSTVLTGIGAAAHIPGHRNIIAYWKDPSDGRNKQVYIDAYDARASIVSRQLHGFGTDVIGGATSVKAADETSARIYLVQDVTIDGLGEFAVMGLSGTTVSMQGSTSVDGDVAIGYEGTQDIDGGTITGDVLVDPTATDANNVGGNVGGTVGMQDLRVIEAYFRELSEAAAAMTPTQTFNTINADTTITGNGGTNVIAIDKLDLRGNDVITLVGTADDIFILNVAGDIDMGGTSNIVTIGTPSANVLINMLGGDFESTGTTHSVSGMVLNPDGNVSLGGTTNVDGGVVAGGDQLLLKGNGAIDFVGFTGTESIPGVRVGVLIKVNHVTAGGEPIMALSRTYDGLAATSATTFVATAGDEVYEFNTEDGSETLLGTFASDCTAIEAAGDTMLVFTNGNTSVTEFNFDLTTTAATSNLSPSKLGSLIAMDADDEPGPIIGYD